MKKRAQGANRTRIKKIKLNRAKASTAAKELGFRSMFEARVAEDLDAAGVLYEYETLRIKYTKEQTYKPDFILANGIIIEAKGKFDSADRAKHILIKQQHPELDIRFVFMRPSQKLYKGAKKSYAEWADYQGFKWANKTVPAEWLEETKEEAKKT